MQEAARRSTTAQAAAEPARGGMLRSLRHRDFLLFWSGLGFALTGFQVQRVGLAFLAYDLTGSALYLTVVFAGDSIPMILLSPIGGVIVDRVNRKTLMLVTRCLIAASALVISLLVWTDTIQAWHLMAFALFTGVCYAFDIPTRQAIIRDLVPEEDFINAVSLSSSVMQGSRIVGPAVGGAALALTGASGTFALMTLGSLGQVVMVAMLRLKDKPRPQTSSALTNLKEGFRFIFRHEAIGLLMVMSAIPAMFAMTYQSLTPIFAEEILGQSESAIGIMLMAAGIGALAGSLTVAAYGERFNRAHYSGMVAILFSGAVILYAVSRSYLLSLGLLVLIGTLGALYSVMNNTAVQARTPREMQGRVMGVYQLTWNSQIVGSLAVGALADWFGAPVALVLAGLVSAAAVGALLLLRPGLRTA